MGQNKMYQFVLFDLDGTILNTIPLIIDTYLAAYRAHQLEPPTIDHIKSGIGIPLKTYIEQTVPGPLVEAYTKTYRRINAGHVTTRIGVFTAARHLLEDLKNAGVPMGIMTSKARQAAVDSLEQFELLDYFIFVRGSEDSAEHKPSPQPILDAVQAAEGILKHPLPLAEVLYVGDNAMDIRSANRAGCPVGIVAWTQMDRQQLAKAGDSFTVASFSDLTDRFV